MHQDLQYARNKNTSENETIGYHILLRHQSKSHSGQNNG